MRFAYLGILLLSLAAMTAVDFRYRLFWFRDARRAVIVAPTAVGFFLLWDLSGIGAGVFARGNGPWMTGLQIAPEIPVEEVLFLLFLIMVTMNSISAAQRLMTGSWGSRSGRRL